VRAAPARLDMVEVGRRHPSRWGAERQPARPFVPVAAAALRIQRRQAGPRAIAPAAPVCSAQCTVNDAAWRFRITGNEKSMPLV
jgi:hypothetical protein